MGEIMADSTPLKMLPQISIEVLATKVLEWYKETPKFMTIVQHADDSDHSEFFCHMKDAKRELIVPRQQLVLYEDTDSKKYVVVKVLKKEDPSPGQEYWLIADCISRTGFLLAEHDFRHVSLEDA